MKHELAVDPLERTCTELSFDDGSPDTEVRRGRTLTVGELADVPAFVLLGEPGMGKSEVMKALARHTESVCVTVNDFIVPIPTVQGGLHSLYIDGLDEARAEGGTTVWRELRRGIVRSTIERFGIACRAADWNTTDRGELSQVTKARHVQVFALDSLTPEQGRSVLRHQGIEDVESFENKAEALGFADMLGNPQSLVLLVEAIKGRNHQWPDNRREAYELACKALVKESNPHHRQAQARSALLSHEALLDAAGWLCALLLLGNRSEVFEDASTPSAGAGVSLSEVLHALPANGPSADAVRQVLQRRLFARREGRAAYVPVHRTVAEYLAGRYVAQRIDSGELLPSRVASLMLATPGHLVSNLRGLAGWLAALCEPLQSVIFEADPAAVLSYGDLHLLPTSTKQALIEHLSHHPNARFENIPWQQATAYAPLVQRDMQAFVERWLTTFRQTAEPSIPDVFVAHVLLSALAVAPYDPGWEPAMLSLIRDGRSTDDIRASAIHALIRHCASPQVLVGLLDEVAEGGLPDARGRLSDQLLRSLYPDYLSPSQAVRYLSPIQNHQGRFPKFGDFWSFYIQKQTRTSMLVELMDALSVAQEQGLFTSDAFAVSSHGVGGLGSVAVSAVEAFGATVPTPQLARWLVLFSHGERSLFRSLSSDGTQQLETWFQAHAERTKEVLKHWVHEEASAWEAQRRMPFNWLPSGMGAFWLAQMEELQSYGHTDKAKECLMLALGWMDQPDSGITLDDLCAAVRGHMELEQALQSRLVSSLDDNWQRTDWLEGREHREKAAARTQMNERNRLYLLSHLDDVRNGELLSYLNEAAWADLEGSGYGGGLNSKAIKQWRATHPELDEATRQGYRALLYQLSGEQAAQAVKSRQKNTIWHFELPCLMAAEQLFSQSPTQFFELGSERLRALLTVYLIHHVSRSDWLLALVEANPEWLEEVWWGVGDRALRSRTQIRIPFLWVLAREPQARELALHLLPRFLRAWPSKFPEESLVEFAQLLEANLKLCPEKVSELVKQRLRRKSLGSFQKAYLVMAGLWVNPEVFAPLIDNLMRKQQLVQSELLGFIGHMHRYGGKPEELPNWDASTRGLLLRLFAPLCKPDFPEGGGWVGPKESGREFLHQVLGAFRKDTSDDAQREMQQLLLDPSLGEWKIHIESALVRQTQFRAEQSFAQPTALQVALSLQNKTPANPADLLAVGLDALSELQREVRNSPTNLINQFWTVDSAGRRPMPPHRPEPQCRNVVAEWLKPRLSAMGLSVDPEHQHGGQHQSDIVLRVQTLGHGDMVLPIEVKGDWNAELWTAPHRQLAMRYASDPACFGQGIYLVLWLGAQRGDAPRPRQHPNHPASTPQAFQRLLQRDIDQKAPGLNIRVVMLDVSIPLPARTDVR